VLTVSSVAAGVFALWELERQWLWHAVFGVMGGEVVVPLPGLAAKRRLYVDLHLLHVKRWVEDLHCRLEKAGVTHELGKYLVAQVQSHGRAHFFTFLFADVGRVVFGEQLRKPRAHDLDLSW
jgi:hypothetical protein